MTDNRLTSHEIDTLCRLYADGVLSAEEERMLAQVLAQSQGILSPEARKTLRLMKIERSLVAPQVSARTFRHRLAGVAASILIALMAGVGIIGSSNNAPETDDAVYVVWRDGRCITGDEAKRIIEDNEKLDMEMLRQVMVKQRELLKVTYASIDTEEFE